MEISNRFNLGDTVYTYDNGKIIKTTVIGVQGGVFAKESWEESNIVYKLNVHELEDGKWLVKQEGWVFASEEDIIEFFKEKPVEFKIKTDISNIDDVIEYTASNWIEFLSQSEEDVELPVSLNNETPDEVVKLVMEYILSKAGNYKFVIRVNKDTMPLIDTYIKESYKKDIGEVITKEWEINIPFSGKSPEYILDIIKSNSIDYTI